MEPGLETQFATIIAMVDQLETLIASDVLDAARIEASRARFRTQIAAHFAFKESLYDWMIRFGGHEADRAVARSRAGMMALIDSYRLHLRDWNGAAMTCDPTGYRRSTGKLFAGVRMLIDGEHAQLVPILQHLCAEGASPGAAGIVPPSAAAI